MSEQFALPAIRQEAEAQSADPGFFDWWLDELAQMTGGSNKRNLRKPIIAYFQNHEFHLVGLKGNQMRSLGTIKLDRVDRSRLNESGSAREIRLLQRTNRPIILRLGPHHGLIAHDLLPAAAAGELRAVIANRLDLITPWSARQACFDYRIVDHTRDGQIEVEINVAPNAVIDPLLDAFADQDIAIDAVDLAHEEPWSPPAVDLLNDGRPTRLPAWLRASAGIGLAACLLGGAFLSYEVFLNHQALDEKRRFAAAVETRAAEMDRIRADIEELRAETDLVSSARNKLPSPLNLVERLSHTLPDDVWLEGLELSGGELALTGYAPSAADLVPMLETVEGLEEVDFNAPSTRTVMSTADGMSFETEQFRLGAAVTSDLRPAP